MSDCCYEWMFHCLILREDHGTGTVLEARPAVDTDAMVAGVLDAAKLQHACP